MMNPPLMIFCCLDKGHTALLVHTHTIFIKEHLRKFPFLFPPFFPSLLQPNRFPIFLSLYSFSLFPSAYTHAFLVAAARHCFARAFASIKPTSLPSCCHPYQCLALKPWIQFFKRYGWSHKIAPKSRLISVKTCLSCCCKTNIATNIIHCFIFNIIIYIVFIIFATIHCSFICSSSSPFTRYPNTNATTSSLSKTPIASSLSMLKFASTIRIQKARVRWRISTHPFPPSRYWFQGFLLGLVWSTTLFCLW